MAPETTEQSALRILMAMRENLGSDVKGVSDDTNNLRKHALLAEMDHATYIEAARYADMMGWVRVRDAIGKPAFSVMILEPGQQVLDDMGL